MIISLIFGSSSKSSKSAVVSTNIKLLSECNINDLIEKTDILIICQSFEWVTPLYQPLFWTWVGIYEEMYGCQYLLIDNN